MKLSQKYGSTVHSVGRVRIGIHKLAMSLSKGDIFQKS